MKKFLLLVVLSFLIGCGSESNKFLSIDLTSKDLNGVEISGLSGPENTGRWTEGPVASFKFPNGLPTDFKLELSANGAFGPNAGKSFKVAVDNNENYFIATNPSQIIDFEFAGISSSSNTIKIFIPDPKSPKELGVSGDPRQIGLMIKSLTIKPATK
jgi:hypothetical protein